MNYYFNIKHLEYFVKTAQVGSLNQAAQLLFISQPRLGKIIRELEVEFKAPLFVRSKKGVTLTPAGTKVLDMAVEVLDIIAKINCRPQKPSVPPDSLSVSMTRFSHIMESFAEVVTAHQDSPSFVHRLYEGIPKDVCEDVIFGRSEVGVLHFTRGNRNEWEREFTAKGLDYHFLACVEPHIILSRNHPLLREGKPVTLDALADYGFIRYLGQYDDLFPALFDSSGGSEPTKAIYVSTRSSVMHLIQESSFYSVGIYDCEHQSHYQVISIPIPLTSRDLVFEFGYVTLQGVPLSTLAQEFITALRKRIF